MESDLARRVRSLMDRTGMKQKDIAELAGISHVTISQMLRGTDVRWSTAQKIVEAIHPLETEDE